MIFVFAILFAAIINLAYMAFLGLAAYAALWLGWQVLTKGSIPTHVVKHNKHVK